MMATRFLSSLGLLGLVVAISLPACSDPAPTCAPNGENFQVCTEDVIYSCPTNDSAAIAANQKIEAACQTATNPVQCLLDAQFTMVDMTMGEDCAAAGKVCVEDPLATPKAASCKDP